MEFLEEAIASYRRAITINSRFTNAYYKLGAAYKDLGEVRRALQSFQKALEIDPLHVESRLGYCQLLHVKQNYKAAESCLMDVLDIDPSAATAHVLAGQLYLQKRNWKRSLQHFRHALGTSPNHPIARHLSSSLIGRHSNEEWRLLYVTEYYDMHAYHYDSTIRNILKVDVHSSVRDAIHDHYVSSKGNRLPQRQLELNSELETMQCDSEGGNQEVRSRSGGRTVHHKDPKENDNNNNNIAQDEEDDITGNDSLYILDMGSGTGILCEAMLEDRSTSHAEIIGVDISRRMNAKALQKNCYKDILHADMGALLTSLEDNEFDVVVAVDVVHHMGDLTDLLHNVKVVLRRGGLFVFTIEELLDSVGSTGPTATTDFSSTSSEGVSAVGERRLKDTTFLDINGVDKEDTSHERINANKGTKGVRGREMPPTPSTAQKRGLNSKDSDPATDRKPDRGDTAAVASGNTTSMSLEEEFAIHPQGVYAHSTGYISELATRYCLDILSQQPVQLPRFETESNFVPGIMFVMISKDAGEDCALSY